MTLAAIQAKCEAHGYTTQLNTTPSIKTIHQWCKGVTKPPRRPKARRQAPNLPPRTRLDQYPQNKGLVELIMGLKAQGLTLMAIVERVALEGFRTTKGTPIGKTQIIRIFQREEARRYTYPRQRV